MDTTLVHEALAVVEKALTAPRLDDDAKDAIRGDLRGAFTQSQLTLLEEVFCDLSDVCYSERRAMKRDAARTAAVDVLTDDQLVALRGAGSFAGVRLVAVDGGRVA